MVINLCYFEFMHRSQLRKEGNLLRNTDYFLGVHMRLELGFKNRTGMPPGTSTPSFCPLWVFIALILQNCSSPFFLMQWRTQRVRPSSEILRLTRRSTWKDWVPLSVHTNSFRKEITGQLESGTSLYRFVMRRQVVLHEPFFWAHETPGYWLPWNFPRKETGNFTNKWIIYVGFKWQSTGKVPHDSFWSFGNMQQHITGLCTCSTF